MKDVVTAFCQKSGNQKGENMIGNDLYRSIEAAGFRIKTFKVEHLNEISTDFERLAAQGLLEAGFYKDNLAGFNYDYESVLESAKSVIVIAAPQGKSIAEFESEGRIIDAVIPPTYIYPGINSRIAGILDNVITEKGYRLAKAVLPLKLLAVKSGLGQYGRNNICYVPGLGSFIRLVAYITDYQFQEDSWGDAKAMESCSTCTLCVEKCPTGAIKEERFLIHAHNCITNFNEYEAPIPEWINHEWHDSMVGCMKCQYACPHNKKLIDLVDERINFDEKETGMILGGNTFESLPIETRDKISYMGMESYYNVLPRNIRLLMNKI